VIGFAQPRKCKPRVDLATNCASGANCKARYDIQSRFRRSLVMNATSVRFLALSFFMMFRT
jgi:hypothetical protein